MSRKTVRKLVKAAGGVHALVQRDQTGSISTSQTDSGTVTVDNTASELQATVTADDRDLVAASSATITIPSGRLSTTEVPVNLSIERDGAQVASVSHNDETSDATAEYTLTTHHPPENDPVWEFYADVDGGSADADYDVDVEDRIA